MGPSRERGSAAQINACLRAGELVVTASERAARSLTAAYHHACRAAGLTAWPTPNIQDWQTFVRSTWDSRISDGRFVLNAIQEHSIWTDIVARRAPEAAQLAGARERLASMAMEAHRLLCAYAPEFLQERARTAWDQDSAAFSIWLRDFDEVCREAELIGTARLPLELIGGLSVDSAERPPLLLAGFDRILPTQQKLFTAWGDFAAAPVDESAANIEFHVAPDLASELAACSLWCKRRLALNPNVRLLIVTQDVSTRRGEIERAFFQYTQNDLAASKSGSLFEFSLGISLGQIAPIRSAGLLLRWLDGPIDEHELDWLLLAGSTATWQESSELMACMRQLRRRNGQRTRWTLADFVRQAPGRPLPDMWKERLGRAQFQLREAARLKQPPLVWAELVPRLLQTASWPGARPLSSVEFQALRRWQQSVDDCASLGFDGRKIGWRDFLAALDRSVSETLFAPESEDAPIFIAGPAESAGLTSDGIWFLGATEDAWPATGATQPLLPLAVQRQAGMPHAAAQLDWDLAAATTRRLIASAPELHFSYARQADGVESRSSRLVVQIAGLPQPLPAELVAPPAPKPRTVDLQDSSQFPFSPFSAPGGADVLTAQSQCPFKAFATVRLGAVAWDRAEAGLTASERGLLLHAVLHSLWSGPPDGIRSHAELVALPDLSAFVEGHVQRVLLTKMPARASDSAPKRYLDLEGFRLTKLVTEWLRFESARVPFAVLGTERKTAVSVNGLPLHLRHDRIDELQDGNLLVIDYKTGNVSPAAWDLPRPDDVQLPLYAVFGLGCPPEQLGGLVFAKIRAGARKEFAGRVRSAQTTLCSSLSGGNSLVKRPLRSDDITGWRDYILQLAADFLAGRADADPRDYPKTCERCRLQAVCRIQENPPLPEESNGGSAEETEDA